MILSGLVYLNLKKLASFIHNVSSCKKKLKKVHIYLLYSSHSLYKTYRQSRASISQLKNNQKEGEKIGGFASGYAGLLLAVLLENFHAKLEATKEALRGYGGMFGDQEKYIGLKVNAQDMYDISFECEDGLKIFYNFYIKFLQKQNIEWLYKSTIIRLNANVKAKKKQIDKYKKHYEKVKKKNTPEIGKLETELKQYIFDIDKLNNDNLESIFSDNRLFNMISKTIHRVIILQRLFLLHELSANNLKEVYPNGNKDIHKEIRKAKAVEIKNYKGKPTPPKIELPKNNLKSEIIKRNHSYEDQKLIDQFIQELGKFFIKKNGPQKGKSRELQRNNIKDNGEIARDGNCFYNAVVKQVHRLGRAHDIVGFPDSGENLRAILASYILNDMVQQYLRPFVPASDFNKVYYDIANPGLWNNEAGDLVMFLLVNLYPNIRLNIHRIMVESRQTPIEQITAIAPSNNLIDIDVGYDNTIPGQEHYFLIADRQKANNSIQNSLGIDQLGNKNQDQSYIAVNNSAISISQQIKKAVKQLEKSKITDKILGKRQNKPQPVDILLEETLNVDNENSTGNLEIHTRERKHKCKVCGQGFNKTSNLKQHMLIHTGERPFECKDCGQCFTQQSNLKQHMLIHTGEKPCQCEFCGRGFTDPSNLKRHILIHTGEKPFQCEFCDQRFNRASSLKNHMRIHTVEGI
ncbi:C2H2 type zinc finger protein [Allofrancisella inopinata]|nr:C2H2 type zinc finger protein [Allofrancisella inopinata]